MSQVQSGILPEHCRAAIWIEANVKGEVDALRAASKTFADKLATFEAKFPDAHLGAVVAFGNNTWRALSGFVDGTENPAGEETRREVAVIKDGVDAGGSYVFVQRWEHNLKQLNRMSVHDQEMMIGRTKEANEEIDGDERPETSHLTRVDLKEDGKGLKIVRQSLPYGTASGTHGLYFCAYCARLHNIEQQLLSMFGDTDGKRDAMLRFTKPVTGGYYFAPSLDKLMAL
ncbi:Dyp-type peroxidase [Escherichia coli]